MPVLKYKENGEWKSLSVNGRDGKNGVTPNISVGTVTTLDPGSNAYVALTGTTKNPILNFGIPKGQDGKDGEGIANSGGTSGIGTLDSRVSKLETKVKNMAEDVAALQTETDDLVTWLTEDMVKQWKTRYHLANYNYLGNRPVYDEMTISSCELTSMPVVAFDSHMTAYGKLPIRQLPDIPESILAVPLNLSVYYNDTMSLVTVQTSVSILEQGDGYTYYRHTIDGYTYTNILFNDEECNYFDFIVATKPCETQTEGFTIPYAGIFFLDFLDFSILFNTTNQTALTPPAIINFDEPITIPGKKLDSSLISDDVVTRAEMEEYVQNLLSTLLSKE